MPGKVLAVMPVRWPSQEVTSGFQAGSSGELSLLHELQSW